MTFVESMWQTRATTSIAYTFAHIERIKQEKVVMYIDGGSRISRSHTEFVLFVRTRYTFLDAVLDNSATLVNRVTMFPVAAVLGILNEDFMSYLQESLAEVVMTIAAIFIAIIGCISPDVAKVVVRSFLGEALLSDRLIEKDSDGKLVQKEEKMDEWIETQLTKEKGLTLAGLRA